MKLAQAVASIRADVARLQQTIAALSPAAALTQPSKPVVVARGRAPVDRLTAAGRNARRLHEGMLEWRLAGLPVEPGAA